MLILILTLSAKSISHYTQHFRTRALPTIKPLHPPSIHTSIPPPTSPTQNQYFRNIKSYIHLLSTEDAQPTTLSPTTKEETTPSTLECPSSIYDFEYVNEYCTADPTKCVDGFVLTKNTNGHYIGIVSLPKCLSGKFKNNINNILVVPQPILTPRFINYILSELIIKATPCNLNGDDEDDCMQLGDLPDGAPSTLYNTEAFDINKAKDYINKIFHFPILFVDGDNDSGNVTVHSLYTISKNGDGKPLNDVLPYLNENYRTLDDDTGFDVAMDTFEGLIARYGYSMSKYADRRIKYHKLYRNLSIAFAVLFGAFLIGCFCLICIMCKKQVLTVSGVRTFVANIVEDGVNAVKEAAANGVNTVNQWTGNKDENANANVDADVEEQP